MEKIPVGLIIKQLIKEKDLDIKEVADRVGIARNTVYQVFGRSKLDDEALTKWSQALGVSTEEITQRQNIGEKKTGLSVDSEQFAQGVIDRIVQELKEQYESRITELKDQIGDLREQLKFNREMVQAFKEGHLGKSEGAIVRPLHIAARA